MFRKNRSNANEGTPAGPSMPSTDQTLKHAGSIQFVQAILAEDAQAALEIYGRQASWEDRDHCISVASKIGGRPEFLDRWVDAWPDHALPLLIRGAHGIEWSWEARTGMRAEHVSAEMFEEFHRRSKLAEADLLQVTRLDPSNPISWSNLLTSARALQIPSVEVDHRMLSMMQLSPLMNGHLNYLQYKCHKWFGSHDEMFSYARSVTQNVPDGSPLHAMWAMAAIEHNIEETPFDFKKGLVSTGLYDEIVDAASRSVHHASFDPSTPAAAKALSIWIMFFTKCYTDHLTAPLVPLIDDRMSDFPLCYYASERKTTEQSWEKMKKGIARRAERDGAIAADDIRRAEEKAAKQAAA